MMMRTFAIGVERYNIPFIGLNKGHARVYNGFLGIYKLFWREGVQAGNLKLNICKRQVRHRPAMTSLHNPCSGFAGFRDLGYNFLNPFLFNSRVPT